MTETGSFSFESLKLIQFPLSGWAISEDESRNWEYRLTLYYAKKTEDSDVFTCKTPRGKRNSVNVVVTGEANNVAIWLSSDF